MYKTLYFISTLLITTLYIACAQEIKRYDVVISEIMADPTPTIGLPTAEYIELFNRTPRQLQLHNWSIKIGNTIKPLPNITIDSNGYIVLVAEKNKDLLLSYCPNLYTLSSLSITDGGQSIVLYNEHNQAIHQVTFKNSWHTEPVKRDGGWSLEMIDTEIPCIGKENWTSSTAEIGGTPGSANASQRSIGDFLSPSLERVTLLDSTTIRLIFTETIHPTLPIFPSSFHLSPEITIAHIQEVPPDFTALDVHLSEPLHNNVLYTIFLDDAICDCVGNYAENENSIVGIAQKPLPGDLVINELLSHPFDGADADYVEIYNRSSKIIDLKDVKIGYNGDTIPNKVVRAVASGRQLPPHQFCAICKDREHTLHHYNCPNPLNLQQNDSLPNFANSNGVIFLSSIGLQTIDKLIYTEDMHYSALTNTEGVSLERIRPDQPTQDESNWHSAASTAGFGTPGYENSQSESVAEHDVIAFTPPVFSPDNDGFEDFTELTMQFSDIENRVTIQIFNTQGKLVKHLANNVFCGTEATFRWDGTDDNGTLLPSNSYIAQIQWWNLSGKSKRVRRVVSVFKQ